MNAQPRLTAQQLVADLLAVVVRDAQGRPGVLVRDVPHLNRIEILQSLARVVEQGVDLRIAYLGEESGELAGGFPADTVTDEVEQAEVWRNTRDLSALIVVVAEFDAARLTSLEDFVQVGPASLRTVLVGQAVAKFGELNDVLATWWAILGKDDQVSFSDLVDYYLSLAQLSGNDLRDKASTEINRLGLLPDPGFFDRPAEAALRKTLTENRDLALRLTNFSEEDRQRVDKALTEEQDDARRATLRGRLRDLQTFRRGGQLNLTAADARQLLRLRKSPPKPPPDDPGDDLDEPTNANSPTTLNGLALERLLGDDATNEDYSDLVVDEAVAAVRDQVNAIDDATVRPEPVGVTLPSGMRVDSTLSTDVLKVLGRLVGEGRYGGYLVAPHEELAGAIRGFEQNADVVALFERNQILAYLDGFSSVPESKDLSDAFGSFDAAREVLLPHLGELLAAPLLVAVAPTTKPLVQNLIERYQDLLKVAHSAFGPLHAAFGDDARALIEQLMMLDVVFIESVESTSAVLTPLHPTLLWHYAEYGRVLSDQREMLEDRDRELIRSEFVQGSVPLFFSSLAVPRALSKNAPAFLPYAGKFGGLPLFGTASESLDPRDGLDAVGRLLETFVSLHPASKEGLRVALLEPPDAGACLALICDLADREVLWGAHVSVIRRPDHLGTDLNLAGDDERRVQQRFGNHSDRRFTFEIAQTGANDVSAPDGTLPHILIAFDQSERLTADSGAPSHRVQALANKRRLVYRIQSKNLDLEPALGGILADFGTLAGLAVGKAPNSYASVHQSDALEKRFRDAASSVPWLVVLDGHVDRDLNLDALRIFTEREGTRDVAAFTSDPASFRRGLREVVRQFNTSISDSKLDELLAELSELLDAGLLSLRPGRSGDVAQSHVRGILGLLVAVQSLRMATPPDHDRIIVSLDSSQARRWLHLSDDPRRADLLVIDASEDGFAVTVVEVKTMQDTAQEFSVADGRVSGPAVDQLLATHRLVAQVLDESHSELLVTPSRREVLRDHLYRELSKAGYDVSEKQRWAQRSSRLFDAEPSRGDLQLRGMLIEVHLGKASSGLRPVRDVFADDKDRLLQVSLVELNEEGVPILVEALTPPAHAESPANREDDQSLSVVTDPAHPAAEDPADSAGPPRALIGMGSQRSAASHEVWFDPQNREKPLSNPHISITGETGSGKTQATKALLGDLLPLGLPALILDFKDDYSDPDYASTEGFDVHDASVGGLPFNPMVPRIDVQTGRVNPVAHAHELGDMLQRIYDLGDQQTFSLREAMLEAYASAGIPNEPFVLDQTHVFPTFDSIKDFLVRDKQRTLLGRLSSIFDLRLFTETSDAMRLDTLLAAPTVIRLSQLPGDTVKNAVSEFFLMALYGYLIRRPHPHRLEQLLVLDEAWRLARSPFLVPLMREGRAFGLGVVVATQFPKDLPEEVGGSTGTRIFFNQTRADQVRDIQRTLIGKTSGQEADHLGNLVRGLAPLECLVQNLQYRPYIRTRATPYYARQDGSADR